MRDEADGVQGGCREEISELPLVPANGLSGKEQTFEAGRVEADAGSGQIRKMTLLLLRKTRIFVRDR